MKRFWRPSHLVLGEIIEILEGEDPNKVLAIGFDDPHSYRGYYSDLAFCIAGNISVADMLKAAGSALGTTYTGWKGGDFQMRDNTLCWLVADHGDTGESIGQVLLQFMLENEAKQWEAR